MGIIFGISDLPVTIVTTPLEPVKIPYFMDFPRRIIGESYPKKDLLVLQSEPRGMNFINRFINGIKKVK